VAGAGAAPVGAMRQSAKNGVIVKIGSTSRVVAAVGIRVAVAVVVVAVRSQGQS
jgi:hypothetical protein